VVTRSYFRAGRGRHHNFDFCDLTHCQFLREPPPPGSAAAEAVRATQGLVITYEEKPVAAMFTRSCGGRTRTPAELGLPVNGYPYFGVVCDYCHQNPSRWRRQVSREDAELLSGQGESGRLAIDRRLGWNAVPGNTYTMQTVNGEVVLEGTGQGHGIGLCQRGTKGMAENGASYREILEHYFPNSSIANVKNSLGR
jgi:stage II sporulation protein D